MLQASYDLWDDRPNNSEDFVRAYEEEQQYYELLETDRCDFLLQHEGKKPCLFPTCPVLPERAEVFQKWKMYS